VYYIYYRSYFQYHVTGCSCLSNNIRVQTRGKLKWKTLTNYIQALVRKWTSTRTKTKSRWGGRMTKSLGLGNCKMFYNWTGTQLSYIEVNLLRLDYIIDFIPSKNNEHSSERHQFPLTGYLYRSTIWRLIFIHKFLANNFESYKYRVS
jgi:hypothetical protein